MPRLTVRDAAGRAAEITIVAGPLGMVRPPAPPPESWAAQPGSEVAIWTVRLEPGAQWTLPAASPGTSRSLYFFRGTSLRADGRAIPASQRLELRSDAEILLQNGPAESELLLLQGRPIGEPVVQHGPFVMNTREEIRETILDYQRTQFGGWPWESDDPVHAREEGRFARHADGHTERPA